jgi:hypothetical protein
LQSLWAAAEIRSVESGVFVFGTVAPAGVIFLGWIAMVTNEIVVKHSVSRQRQE